MKSVFERLTQAKQLKPSKERATAVLDKFQLLPLAKAPAQVFQWEAEGKWERTDNLVGELARALAGASGDDIADQDALLPLLRAIPSAISDRRRAVFASLALCSSDGEARDFVRSADHARDKADWAGGEYAYWRVISLYPLHPGYHVQYGHCLKEQGKYLDAEINYRTAFALGDVEGDLGEHIAFVAARRNQGVGASTLARVADFWRVGAQVGPLDTPPIREDIVNAYRVLLGRGPGSSEEIASILSSSPNLRSVLNMLVSRQDFLSANRHLLAYIVETGWPK